MTRSHCEKSPQTPHIQYACYKFYLYNFTYFPPSVSKEYTWNKKNNKRKTNLYMHICFINSGEKPGNEKGVLPNRWQLGGNTRQEALQKKKE